MINQQSPEQKRKNFCDKNCTKIKRFFAKLNKNKKRKLPVYEKQNKNKIKIKQKTENKTKIKY